MVHPEIRRIFDEHVARIDSLGNGNFGQRDAFLDPNIEVFARNSYDGEIRFKSPRFALVYNCARVAFDLAEDLQKHGFTAKKKYVINKWGYTQNYVEVDDPQTGQPVQLDATPWFGEIGTGHNETGSHPDYDNIDQKMSFIQPNGGQFLSTIKLPDSTFIDTYLAGGYFSVTQNIERIGALAAAEREGRQPVVPENPQYLLRLWSIGNSLNVCPNTTRVDIRLDIYDSTKIFQIANESGGLDAILREPEGALARLVQSGAAKLIIEDTAAFHLNNAFRCLAMEETGGGNSFSYLRDLQKQGMVQPEIAARVTSHLPVLANIVFHLGPTLRTAGNDTLRMGRFGAKLDLSASRYFGMGENNPHGINFKNLSDYSFSLGPDYKISKPKS